LELCNSNRFRGIPYLRIQTAALYHALTPIQLLIKTAQKQGIFIHLHQQDHKAAKYADEDETQHFADISP
jgi:hypothetical protein